jgi:hypothetical protein
MPEELRKQVEVVTGDVLVREDVDKVVEGRDAIVVTLGTRNDLGEIVFNKTKLGRLRVVTSHVANYIFI